MSKTTLKGAHLSLQQERLWLLQQEGTIHGVKCTFAISGNLNFEALERALQQLAEQYTIFQTLFYALPGMDMPVQVIGHVVELFCPIISLELMARLAQEAMLETLQASLHGQPFDLKRGPLFRSAIVRLAADRALLLVSLPALYADAPTLSLLIEALTKHYIAALRGEAVDEDVLQYTTVASWQRQQAEEESEEAQAATEFWRRVDWAQITKIQRYLEQAEMIEKKRTVATSSNAFEPTICQIAVNEGILSELAIRHTVSVPIVLLASWLILLHRLTAESQLVIGIACNGRNYEELKEVLGPLTRFVPLEIALQHSWSFAHVIALLAPLLEASEEYQNYFSWPSAIHNNQVSNALAFFPIVFEHEQWPTIEKVGGIHIQLNQRACWTEPFLLKLSVLEIGNSIQIELHYDTQKVSRVWANQLASMLQTLLYDIYAQPQKQISALSLLNALQRRYLLTTFSGTRRAESEENLHRLFEAQVRQRPTALAVISRQEQLTYQHLNTRANQLAHILRQRGIGPDMLVGLCLPRQASMLIGLLGILKAGGAYLPLDTNSPAQRLQYQLQESGAKLLLTQEDQLSALPNWTGTTLCLEALTEELAQSSANDLEIQSLGGHLAYVVYTSGSTGTPKGVMISQSNVVNYTRALCQQIGAEPGWQYTTVSTLAADLGNTTIFCALASGGCIHVLDYETVTSGETMAAWAEQHPIDVLKIVPSHLSALLESTRAQVFLPRRALLLGGEALSRQLVGRVRRVSRICHIYNHYGPTETTIGTLVNDSIEQESVESEARPMVALGSPIANTDAYILDPHLQLVPPGVMGELYIGGAGIARGYVGQGGLTAERFVPHPYSKVGGERLYRTGDLARYNQQELIEFVGRQDGQVKVRGYRIEMGEIDMALRQHAQVRDCVVILREDMPGGAHLVGYIVPKKWPLPADMHIRDFLQQRLPDYMLPTMITYLKFLPLTANGKIDRRRLLAGNEAGEQCLPLLIDTTSETRTIIPPRDILEMQLLQIWETVLQFQPISIVDDFFDIGGHSLLAVQLISHIAEQLGKSLDLTVLFRHPTIAEMAIALRQQQVNKEEPLLAAIQTQGMHTPFFCVHPAGGTSFCYISLARCLGTDQPFYGLHAPFGASNGGEEKTIGNSIEEMAAHYIAVIQTIQPQGPYLLGGWSLGGVIALEMAQQLQQQGYEIGMLAIMDSTISDTETRDAIMSRDIDLSDVGVLRNFIKTAKLIMPDDFEQKTLAEQFDSAMEVAKKQHIIPEDTSIDLVRLYMRVRILTKRIAHVYIGNEYTGQIDYFLSSEITEPQEELDDIEGEIGDSEEQLEEPMRLWRWRELAKGGLAIHQVPGNHSEMLDEPYVQVLAKMLQQRIEQVYEQPNLPR